MCWAVDKVDDLVPPADLGVHRAGILRIVKILPDDMGGAGRLDADTGTGGPSIGIEDLAVEGVAPVYPVLEQLALRINAFRQHLQSQKHHDLSDRGFLELPFLVGHVLREIERNLSCAGKAEGAIY